MSRKAKDGEAGTERKTKGKANGKKNAKAGGKSKGNAEETTGDKPNQKPNQKGRTKTDAKPDGASDGQANTKDKDAKKGKGKKDEEPAPRRPAAVRPEHSIPTSPEAKEFAGLLAQLVQSEFAVQVYEMESLGQEDGEVLQGHRQKRWLRIQDDAKHFRGRVSQFSLQPLPFPKTKAGKDLGKRGLAFLAQLAEAYQAARDPRELRSVLDWNGDFLRTANWQLRDRAVRTRDEIIEREIAYARLSVQAWGLLDEEASDATLDELVASLTEIAPETMGAGGDIASLVLETSSCANRSCSRSTPCSPARTPIRARPRTSRSCSHGSPRCSSSSSWTRASPSCRTNSSP